MRDEIARGQRAGLAAQNVHDMRTAQGRLRSGDPADPQPGAAAGRPGAASQLDTAAALLGVPPSIDQVLLRAMRQVGTWSDAA